MAENHKQKPPTVRYGLDNPHPLSRLKTELVWEGKYDEYGNRRIVDIAGCAMPLQKIETIDEPRSRAAAKGQIDMFEQKILALRENAPEYGKNADFRNRLIWGDNKLVMASLLADFKGKVDLIYIDPPFDVGADFTMDVPIGNEEETVAKDQSTLEMVGEVREDETEEFISRADFDALPPAHQKMVQQAIGLFQFLEKKTGQSFAPVFTPLLGPLDEAARAVMLKLLGPDIPTEHEQQRVFFEPDLSHLSDKDAEMFRRRCKDLKRTLVDHNGMSPIGLLRWCLQYSRKPSGPTGVVFDAVNRRFSGVPEAIYKLVNVINTFRNDYVAHQEKELTDGVLARKALAEWSSGLRRIWELHH